MNNITIKFLLSFIKANASESLVEMFHSTCMILSSFIFYLVTREEKKESKNASEIKLILRYFLKRYAHSLFSSSNRLLNVIIFLKSRQKANVTKHDNWNTKFQETSSRNSEAFASEFQEKFLRDYVQS